MKKLLIIFALLVSGIYVVAQSPSIDDIVAKYNAKCPIAIADITLNGVEQGDSMLIFNNSVSDDMFAHVTDLAGILHDSMAAELMSTPDPLANQLIDLCKKTNTKIVQRLINSKGDKFDVVLLPTEL